MWVCRDNGKENGNYNNIVEYISGYVAILDNKMEATTMGLYRGLGFRVGVI